MKRRDTLGALLALGAGACAGLPATPTGGESARGVNFLPAVPYVPTRPEIVDAMLEMGAIGHEDVVYDLGCGDGRLVIAAAKRYGATGLGVDNQPEQINMAQSQAHWEGVSNRVRFSLGDLFELDTRPATVVMLYLSVELNIRLRPKLLAELRPGSRIVSNRFDMAGVWRPAKSVVVAGTPVHLWHVGAPG